MACRMKLEKSARSFSQFVCVSRQQLWEEKVCERGREERRNGRGKEREEEDSERGWGRENTFKFGQID